MTELFDVTQTYEVQDDVLSEQYYQTCIDYMDNYSLVNRSEIDCCAQEVYKIINDLGEDYELSYGEILESQKIAEEYIRLHNVQFDSEGYII